LLPQSLFGWSLRENVETQRESVDQICPIRSAPAGAKVVTGNGGKIGRTVPAKIISRGDVVKVSGVIDSLADGIKRLDYKTNGRLAGGGGLLIDERGEGRPQRRGTTRSAERAGLTVVVFDRKCCPQ